MKTFFLRYMAITILACSISCNKTKKQPSQSQKSMLTEEVSECLSSDFKIYGETALMWEKSWATNFGMESSAQIKFSQENLKTLKSLESEAPGLRLYYCLINPSDTIPALAMVNIDNSCTDLFNCKDVNCVLLSEPGNANEYFIDEGTLNTYHERWKAHINAKGDIHTPVYAYNYEWSNIENIIDTTVDAPGIWVKYGLRTLSPTEFIEYGREAIRSGDDIITGSIVYCNILYGKDQISRNRTSEEDDDDDDELFDFAKPCPRYCN